MIPEGVRGQRDRNSEGDGIFKGGVCVCVKDRHVHSHQDTDTSKMLPVSHLSPSCRSSPLADEKNRAER